MIPEPYNRWETSEIDRSLRSCGTLSDTTNTVRIVMLPPNTTDGTVPIIRAATPDSKAPISFDDPMKIWFTADTRPRMALGVRSCTSVWRRFAGTSRPTPRAKSRKSSWQQR